MKFVKYLPLVVISMLSANAFAQDGQTATLTLRGSVSPLNEIVITPDSMGKNVALDILAGEKGTVIAQAVEKSNSLSGFTINLFSANSSQLVGPSGSTNVDYKLTYVGALPAAQAVPVSAGSALVPQLISTQGVQSGLTSYSHNIKIDIDAYPNAAAGTYSDTASFVIAKQ